MLKVRCALGALLVSGALLAPSAAPAAQWSPAGSMAAEHYGAVSAVLGDGTVLVAGGASGGSGITTAERFDPRTLAWSPAAPLGTPRQFAAGVALADGRVLAAGGQTSGSLASAEVYDPAAGAWTPIAPMHAARDRAEAVRLADGRVLMVGGQGTGGTADAAEVYDPAAGTWTPTAPMAERRYGSVVVRLADGRVLVAGGYALSGGGYRASAEVYDPATNAWTTVAPMGEPRLDATGTLLPGGRVLVAGGHGWPTFPESSATAEIYDPATDTWAPTGALRVPRGEGATMAALPDGRAMVIGGFRWATVNPGPPQTWSDARYDDDAEIYDPASGTWSAAAGRMSAGRAGHVTAVLAGGSVLAAGGFGTRTADLFGARTPATPAPPSAPPTSPPAGKPAAKPSAIGFLARPARTLTVSKAGKIRIVLRCSAGAGSCADRLVLKTRGRGRARQLAGASVKVPSGRTATVSMTLSRAARKQLRGRTTAARVTLVKRGRGLDVRVRGERAATG